MALQVVYEPSKRYFIQRKSVSKIITRAENSIDFPVGKIYLSDTIIFMQKPFWKYFMLFDIVWVKPVCLDNCTTINGFIYLKLEGFDVCIFSFPHIICQPLHRKPDILDGSLNYISTKPFMSSSAWDKQNWNTTRHTTFLSHEIFWR